MIKKAHQRKIRELKSTTDTGGLFGNPENPDIKDAELKEINYQTAKLIIEEYEWLGTMGTTQFHYGIFYNKILAGVVCFGYFQSPNGYANYIGEKYNKKGVQLTRGACVHWAHPHSGSKLIAYGLKKMAEKGYKYVIAFSDSDAGEIGTLYQATNWFYVGRTKLIHYELYKTDGRKYMDARDIYKRIGIDSKSRKRIQEYATQNNLIVKPLAPKARYIKLIGDKRENKEMMKTLKDRILPYPKRVNYFD